MYSAFRARVLYIGGKRVPAIPHNCPCTCAYIIIGAVCTQTSPHITYAHPEKGVSSCERVGVVGIGSSSQPYVARCRTAKTLSFIIRIPVVLPLPLPMLLLLGGGWKWMVGEEGRSARVPERSEIYITHACEKCVQLAHTLVAALVSRC